jgi:hypothetical protein
VFEKQTVSVYPGGKGNAASSNIYSSHSYIVIGAFQVKDATDLAAVVQVGSLVNVP